MSFKLNISPKDRAAGRFKSKAIRQFVTAIRKAKLERGVSQNEIAETIGVDKSLVSRVLSGESNLTLKTIGEFAWALDLEVDLDLKPRHKLVGNQIVFGDHAPVDQRRPRTNSGTAHQAKNQFVKEAVAN